MREPDVEEFVRRYIEEGSEVEPRKKMNMGRRYAGDKRSRGKAADVVSSGRTLSKDAHGVSASSAGRRS